MAGSPSSRAEPRQLAWVGVVLVGIEIREKQNRCR